VIDDSKIIHPGILGALKTHKKRTGTGRTEKNVLNRNETITMGIKSKCPPGLYGMGV